MAARVAMSLSRSAALSVVMDVAWRASSRNASGESAHGGRIVSFTMVMGSLFPLTSLSTLEVHAPRRRIFARSSRIVTFAVVWRRKGQSHVLELRLRLHLLRIEGGLDSVEQALEPADELGLGDAELALARRAVAERQAAALQLGHQLWRETVLELGDRLLVDLAEPGTAGIVERRGLHLLEQLADHAADAHDLGGLLDEIGQRAPAVLRRGHLNRLTVGADDRGRGVVGFGRFVVAWCHAPQTTDRR